MELIKNQGSGTRIERLHHVSLDGVEYSREECFIPKSLMMLYNEIELHIIYWRLFDNSDALVFAYNNKSGWRTSKDEKLSVAPDLEQKFQEKFGQYLEVLDIECLQK